MKSPRAALEPEAAPPPPPASRHARNQWVVIGNLIVTVLLIGLVGGLAGFLYARQAFVAPGPLQQDRAVFIERGSNAEQVAQTLERNGVISSALLFTGAVQLYGVRGDLKWGEYLFPKQVSTAGALAIVLEGKPIEYRITIPEGLTSEQIVMRLNDNDVLTGDVNEIPPEGSLLPDTYKFQRGSTRQAIVDRMTRDQRRILNEVWAKRPADLPIKTPQELVILASIVEKETGLAAERPRVAAVFVNRLRQGMKLESDPTIIYGLTGGRPLGRGLRQSELDAVNPYSTYQIDGLPPGPIANPGRASLAAVLNPPRTSDRYFVADGTGGHVFAANFDDHLENVARWRKVEQARAAQAAKAAKATGEPTAASGTAGQ